MNVVILEDESLSAHRLATLLRQYDSSITVVAVLASVVEAKTWFSQRPANLLPQLVFMDIHLEDGSAFGLVEQLQLRIPLIFTTAYDAYAIQAFKTNSVDYLLKPIDETELAAAIDKFKWTQHNQQRGMASPNPWPAPLHWQPTPDSIAYKERFMVTLGTKIKSIAVPQIAYFFHEERTTYLTTRDGQTLVVEYSIDHLAMLLNPNQFFRVNRSYLVNLSAIDLMQTYSGSKLKLSLEPPSRQEVFVSADRLKAFKSWLGK